MSTFEWFLLVVVVIVVPLVVAVMITLWTLEQARQRNRQNRESAGTSEPVKRQATRQRTLEEGGVEAGVPVASPESGIATAREAAPDVADTLVVETPTVDSINDDGSDAVHVVPDEVAGAAVEVEEASENVRDEVSRETSPDR